MTIFCHASVFHWLSNLAALLIFAPRVWRAIGGLQCLGLAIIAGELSNALASILIDRPVIGASSAVFALMGAWWVLFPHDRLARAGIAATVALQLVFWSIAPDFGNVAWPAHVMGALFGAAIAMVLRSGRRRPRMAMQ